MKTGLVLEGGGMRGMYTAGVLDVMMDKEIPADGIFGVSAGALFGVNYFSGQQGRAIRYNLKYAKDCHYMGLRSLITTGNIVGREFAYYEVPMKLDVFDNEAFKRHGGDFYAVATNVRTGEAEYLKIDSVFDQMEALRATSAMPLVSKMVKYGDQYYLDGGIADSVPLAAFERMGYARNVVVLTKEEGFKRRSDNIPPLNFRYRSDELVELKLEIDREKLPDVEEWLGIDNIEPRGNKFIAEISAPDDDGLISKILGFGGGVRVLSPAPLREKVIEAARKIIDTV